MPEALEAAYPHTTLQTCIVHLIRHSLEYASWRDRKLLAAALKTIYAARLKTPRWSRCKRSRPRRSDSGFRRECGLAACVAARHPFFAFPPAIRRLLYTTNALENVHRQLRKIIKTRGHFPNDDAATKLLWLALRNITVKWVASTTRVGWRHESLRHPVR